MRNGRYIFYGLAWAWFLYIIFWNLGNYQLELFDEARRGVSALEMYQGKAHPLVPTYAGQLEHWGTKPSLLVNLQTLAVSLFGPDEWSVRLPAALATLLTLALLAWFSRLRWGSVLVGTLAGIILLCNWNFIGSHGARSGDFDALLLLFTLGQILFYFEWINTKRNRYLVMAALSLLLAGWTKGIAGCMLLPAIGLWTLLDANARKELFNWRIYLAFGLGLAGIGSYYLLRETVDPGYLSIMFEHEVTGRFFAANEGSNHPWYHYLVVLAGDRSFFLFVLLSLPGAALMYQDRKERSLVLLLLLSALSFLVVISTSATKMFWYLTPILPYIALISAWTLIFIGRQLVASSEQRVLQTLIPIAFIGLFFFAPIRDVSRKVQQPEAYLGLSELLSYKAGIQNELFSPPFTVITPDYHANARFYVAQQKILGREISIEPINSIDFPKWTTPRGSTLTLNAGTSVLICENDSWIWMAENYHYREMAEASPCKLVEILGVRE